MLLVRKNSERGSCLIETATKVKQSQASQPGLRPCFPNNQEQKLKILPITNFINIRKSLDNTTPR